jgi:hypothetical protein
MEFSEYLVHIRLKPLGLVIWFVFGGWGQIEDIFWVVFTTLTKKSGLLKGLELKLSENPRTKRFQKLNFGN